MSASQGNKDVMSYLADFESTCDEYLVRKAPALPAGVKELLVQFGPFLLILYVVSVALKFLRIDMFYSVPLGYYGGIAGTISTVLIVASAALTALAIPGLLQRSRKGWNLLYYSTFVTALSTLGVVEILVVLLVSMYILFQVKSYYK